MAFDRLWPGEDFLPAVPNPEEPSLDENDPGINGFTPDPGSEVKNLPAEVANVVEESPVQPEIFTPVSENSN